MPPSSVSNTTVLRILIVCAWQDIPVLQRTAKCSKQHLHRNGVPPQNTSLRPHYDNVVAGSRPDRAHLPEEQSTGQHPRQDQSGLADARGECRLDLRHGDHPLALPAAGLTTSARQAYGSSSSRARAASGMPVMPTMSHPSRSIRTISATVSRRGPGYSRKHRDC